MLVVAKRAGLRGNTLIEILVVLVILTLLSGIGYQYFIGGKNEKGQKVKTPMQAGKSTACLMNLQQVRQGIQLFKSNDIDNEKPPQTLDELKFPRESLICPDSKQPYIYESEKGEVHCATPGHEKN